MRREPSDLSDLPHHLHTLEITAIEPSEVWRSRLDRLPVDQLHHRHDPPRISELIQPTLIRLLDTMPAEVAREGIAPFADRSRYLLKLRTGEARLRWNAPCITGHLRRTGQPAHDLPCLVPRETDDRLDRPDLRGGILTGGENRGLPVIELEISTRRDPFEKDWRRPMGGKRSQRRRREERGEKPRTARSIQEGQKIIKKPKPIPIKKRRTRDPLHHLKREIPSPNRRDTGDLLDPEPI